MPNLVGVTQLAAGGYAYEDQYGVVDGIHSFTVSHSLTLNGDGKVYAFGANNLGQLGTGDNVDRTTPTEMSWHKVADKQTETIHQPQWMSISRKTLSVEGTFVAPLARRQ